MDTTIRSARDFSSAHELYMDVFRQVHGVATKNVWLSYPTDTVDQDDCLDTLTLSPPTGPFPIQVGINFNDGESCEDDRTHSGLIAAAFTGRWLDSAATITISPQAYEVNGYLVTGTMTVHNLGWDGSDLVYAVTVADGVISQDTVRIEMDATYEIRWTDGQSSVDIDNDEFEIGGTASGRTNKGSTFTATISTPLRMTGDCRWSKSGTVRVKPSNLSTRSLLYGSGDSCDPATTVVVNAGQREMNLID